MLPVSSFAPVHRSRRNARQNQSDLNLSGKKRKRIDDDGDTDGLDHEEYSEDERVSGDESFLSGVSSPATASVRAGALGESNENETLELDNETHGVFSHQVIKAKRSLPEKAINMGLRELLPPLLSARRNPSSGSRGSSESSRIGARQRHLAVLTTIMHRSLLQNDYSRAGRAWSMILRTELNGHSLDPRNSCRWGLGAEILLRQPGQLAPSSDQTDPAVELDQAAAQTFDQYCSIDGFERTKQYYDRLSLQYPYNKVYPDATSPLDFHLAMFSLWIYTSTNQQPLDVDGHQAVHAFSAKVGPDHERREESRKEALHRAGEISDKLDELLSSPPYSDTEKYKSLRRMVALWTEDLALASPTAGPDRTERHIQRGESAEDFFSITGSPTSDHS